MHKKQAKKSQQFLCVEFDELSENIHLPVRSGTHSPNAKEELPSYPNAVRELGVSEILWPCIRPVPLEDCDVGVLCLSCPGWVTLSAATQHFLASALRTRGAGSFFVVESCPVHYGTLSHIPGPPSRYQQLRPSLLSPMQCDHQKCVWTESDRVKQPAVLGGGRSDSH